MKITGQQFIDHCFEVNATEFNTKAWECFASGWELTAMPNQFRIEGIRAPFVKLKATRDGFLYQGEFLTIHVIDDIEK